MNSKAEFGFTWIAEVVAPDGTVSQREVLHNLIPDEGVAHMMGVTFKQSAQVATWYIALYEGNYTPTNDITAAQFPALATECTTYTPTSRVEWVEGSVVGGSVDNSAAKAEFTFTAAKTVYGGVLTSASAKGATTGLLISAVRFASPKVLEVGAVLRVVAGNALVSA
ncbi:MAG: hypothetical protein JSS14_21825 [Proteobacteria bacterium]|nr:hypothetical protein [Pseudomonadota bacterium]